MYLLDWPVCNDCGKLKTKNRRRINDNYSKGSRVLSLDPLLVFGVDMLPEQVVSKVEKVIQLGRDEFILNNVYINPAFADDIYRKVPELRDLNVSISKTETETNIGSIISAVVRTLKGEYELGSVLLDGENVRVYKPLSTIDGFIDFLKYELGTKI